MNFTSFEGEEELKTPSFIYDLNKVEERIDLLIQIKKELNCKILYSLKALPLYNILEKMKDLDGFSVSSLFEAKLVEKIFKEKKEIHFISPGIREDQWKDISRISKYLTFNSFEQLSYFGDSFRDQSYGIRINPELSLIQDERYDPCRAFSKLGVPLIQLKQKISSDKTFFKKIQGIHLHTNCESNDFFDLTRTFLKIKEEIGDALHCFKWINLGGGYFFNESKNLSLFNELIHDLNQNYSFEDIIIEPGSFVVRDSGYLVSSVIDLFEREGKKIAILDTTVNHLPEVFEYQYEPDVLGHHSSHQNEYTLAGSSCLAGDIFGTYLFQNKLNIGSKIFFEKVGSYSLVKAHTFNGINLPDIYCFENKTGLKRVKSFTLKDYINHYGG